MTLTPRTKMQLSLVIGILGLTVTIGATGFAGVYQLGRFGKGFEDRMDATEKRQSITDQNIEKMLGMLTTHESQLKDRFTLTAAAETALRQAIENPGLRVVDPRDPSRVIVVSNHTTRTGDQP